MRIVAEIVRLKGALLRNKAEGVRPKILIGDEVEEKEEEA
jgi:hypothetical protein